MIPVTDGACNFPRHVERPLQIRREGSEIVRGTRPVPSALRHRFQFGGRTEERCGDARQNRCRRRCLFHGVQTRVVGIAPGQFRLCIFDRPLQPSPLAMSRAIPTRVAICLLRASRPPGGIIVRLSQVSRLTAHRTSLSLAIFCSKASKLMGTDRVGWSWRHRA
jgi:hypothetical protein